jgi:hypothetical protein
MSQESTSEFAVPHLEEIGEISDGRVRGVRCATSSASRPSESMRGQVTGPEIGSSTSTTRKEITRRIAYATGPDGGAELIGWRSSATPA